MQRWMDSGCCAGGGFVCEAVEECVLCGVADCVCDAVADGVCGVVAYCV